jgi:hypothetical protein
VTAQTEQVTTAANTIARLTDDVSDGATRGFDRSMAP